MSNSLNSRNSATALAELGQYGWRVEQNIPNGDIGQLGRAVVNHGRLVEVKRFGDRDTTQLSEVGLSTQLALTPVAGDWVVISHAGLITDVLPRSSSLARGSKELNQNQVLGANVDLVLIVTSVSPVPNLTLLERLAVMAWDSGATPVAVLTKADLAGPNLSADLENVAAALPGMEVILTSTKSGLAVEQIRNHIVSGKTAVMVGPSGAGKTSLLNSLTDYEATVGEMGRDGNGTHTTTSRRLYLIPGGGLLMDIPGIRSLDLLATTEGLTETFEDITHLVTECRYRNCQHSRDEGCAVRAAVVEGQLTARRVKNWMSLQADIDRKARLSDPISTAQQRSDWKQVSKQAKANKRMRGY